MRSKRKSQASVALISRITGGQRLWLARWNSSWDAYAFVGGHREEGESFRECMVREIGEELILAEDDDFRIPANPETIARYTDFSRSAGVYSDYEIALFAVELGGEHVVEKLQRLPGVRWLVTEEIRTGNTADGFPVSPTVARLLKEYGVNPDHG